MEVLLPKLMDYLKALAEFFGYVVMAASVVVRFTKSKKDDLLVEKAETFFSKLVLWLPTLGPNPETVKLKKALENERAKKAQDASIN